MKDYVYYLMVEEELLVEYIFETRAEAIEYAETNEIQNYKVVEWDVD